MLQAEVHARRDELALERRVQEIDRNRGTCGKKPQHDREIAIGIALDQTKQKIEQGWRKEYRILLRHNRYPEGRTRPKPREKPVLVAQQQVEAQQHPEDH